MRINLVVAQHQDDPTLQHYLASLPLEGKVKLRYVADGPSLEGLTVSRRRTKKEVVLVDLDKPLPCGMDGWQVVKVLRLRDYRGQCVVVSSSQPDVSLLRDHGVHFLRMNDPRSFSTRLFNLVEA